MDKKNTTLLWSISLLIISIVTLIWAGSNIIGIELPDIMIRILGVLDIISIPVLVYTSIKRKK